MSDPTEADLNRPLWAIWDSGIDCRLLYLYEDQAEAIEYAAQLNAAESREVFSVHPVTSNHGRSPDAVIAAAREVVRCAFKQNDWELVCDPKVIGDLEKAIADYDVD